jgi:hypothetical protein
MLVLLFRYSYETVFIKYKWSLASFSHSFGFVNLSGLPFFLVSLGLEDMICIRDIYLYYLPQDTIIALHTS